MTALWLAPLLAAVPAFKLGRKWAAFASGAVLLWSAWLYAPMMEAGGVLESAVPVGWGISYALKLDGLSLSLCWLTALLTLLCVVATREESGAFWASFLALEGALMGVFLARDLFLFYVFWEAVLIPMFFIIGLWGSDNRRHAAMKFFLFTFFGGTFLLIGALILVTLHWQATGTWTWDLATLEGPGETPLAVAVYLMIALGLAVKIPLVPLHTWLPDAHTEAPAAGSVMLAGVMLKMGVYGILRVLWPLFPTLTVKLMPWLGLIAVVNCVYGALCAMAQSDLKRLIAYSSVAHLGFCVLGVVSGTAEGVAGGSLQMLNHGLTTGALFFTVGFLYDRAHTRGIDSFGGLIKRAPWMTFLFGFSIMASIGLPGLNGFVGEFMALSGMARVDHSLAFFGVVGVTLAAAYSLPAFQTVFWSEEGEGSVSHKVTDLAPNEKAVLLVLCALMLAIGLYPTPLLGLLTPALKGAVWF